MGLRQTRVKFVVLVTMLIAGCGTTERDWKQAKEANTASGYAEFLAKHPQGAHVDEARAAIDEIDWNLAKGKNTSADYQNYLAVHTAGRHVVQAKAAIEAIEEDADWTSAKAKNKRTDFQKYLASHAAGRHAADAKAAIDAIEAMTYVALNLPCGARVANMGFTFFGTPSGELVGFECQEKGGKTVNIKLKSKTFTDGKIQTEEFGVIVMKNTNGTAAAYEILQGQFKKLQARLGF